MSSKTVRMFGDWDYDSAGLVDLVKRQTNGFVGDRLRNVEFVSDESYQYAVVFNFPTQDIGRSPEYVIGLVLEPPEICEWMHSSQVRKRGESVVGRYYSFAMVDGYEYAPCIGFSTATPFDSVPSEKPSKLCMIASTKTYTDYHVKRRSVLDRLLDSNIPIDFYGRGMPQSDDPRVKGEIPPMGKDEILKQYSMCIDFENSPTGVLTDKFFDPILCGTVPVTNASVLLTEGVRGSFEYVNFSESTDQIVDRIAEVAQIEDFKCYDDPVNVAKTEVMCGKMNLAHWIVERINE